MSTTWDAIDTTKHQDHVIAHVLGTNVLGYFVFDETVHLLLDIGFIWSIYLDGQMVLLPYSVAMREIEMEAMAKAEIKNEIEVLLSDGEQESSQHMVSLNIESELTEVNLFARSDEMRIVLRAAETGMSIETSSVSGTIRVLVGD